MKIKSEYTILSECIERGITAGHARALKNTDTPNLQATLDTIHDAVMGEIAEYFVFENEHVE